MDAKVYKSALFNSYSAASVVVTDTSVTPNVIRIPGLMPMNVGEIKSVRSEAYVAEVRQVYTLGLSTVPVITASTKYQLRIGNSGPRTEGWQNPIVSVGYTSPSTLTGTAATDRHAAYVALAQRINANPAIFADAYPLITLAYDGQTGNFTVGSTVTGGTSGASGIIVTDVDGGATGTLTIALTTLTTDFQNNEVITDTATGSADVNGTQTNGIGLRIVDQAGYYSNGRAGVNVVLVTAGFTSPMLVETTAGVVGRYSGTQLLARVPVKELTTPNLSSGDWEMNVATLPVTTNNYTRVVIIDQPNTSFGNLGGGAETVTRTQVVWLNEGDADLAATVTALENLD